MIALSWNDAVGSADLALNASGALAGDDGLETAVVLSLFLDVLAERERAAIRSCRA